MEIQLSKLLQKSAVSIVDTVDSKEALLRLLAKGITTSDSIGSETEETILAKLKEREKICSTGFGKGIAIPHCKSNEITQFSLSVIVVKEGVDFDSMDKKPVHVAVAIAGPESERNGHLHLLSKLSRILNDESAITEILSADSAEAIEEAIIKRSPEDLAKNSEESVLFHVFIQKEVYFEKIIEVFTGMEHCSLSIVNTDESAGYLGSVPLFKGFFAEDTSFSKLLIATIPKKIANETVRQVELVTGNLKKQTGILITVQDLVYINGSLNY